MRKFLLSRLAQGLLLVFTVSVVVFSLLYIMPGDPVDYMTSEMVPQERKAEMRTALGLDQPLPVQYASWLGKVVQGDLGKSFISKIPVVDSLASRVPITLKIALWSLALQLVVAVPLGLLAAYKKDGLADRILMAMAGLFQSIPNFWAAMLLILLFGVALRWLPINGYETARHYILPVVAISLGGIAGTLRMTKAEVLDAMREKYVQTARAKGLSKNKVILRHVLRNSLILVTVMVFTTLPWLISGSVIMENIFVIPGVGTLLTQAIRQNDFPVVQACILIIATLTVVCNTACDMLLAVLDPRIRLEGGAA